MILGLGGDPTALGWLITVAYGLVAVRCWRCADPRRFWVVVALALALLCLNKQLDVQTGLTAWARAMAKEQGWYATRKGVQVAALSVGLLLVVAVAGGVGWWLRRDLARIGLALLGLSIIGVYAALRMTSIHEVDVLVVAGPFPAAWWAELVGLSLIAWSAARARTVSRVS